MVIEADSANDNMAIDAEDVTSQKPETSAMKID